MADQETEVVKFRATPNAFLYALEATKIHFLMMVCLAILLSPVIYIRQELQISTLLLFCFILFGGAFVILFLFTFLIARSAKFIVTDQRVIARFTIMGRADDKISVALLSIKSIEIRAYNSTYGSVYLDKYKDGRTKAPESFHSVRPVLSTQVVPFQRLSINSNPTSIWFSVPASSPPLSGFYGFKNYGAFARAIMNSQESI